MTQVPGHDGDIYAGRWSPNGKYLATACADGAARLWTLKDIESLDSSELHSIATLSHQDDPVSKLESDAPDTREVVTLDWHVRLLNVLILAVLIC